MKQKVKEKQAKGWDRHWERHRASLVSRGFIFKPLRGTENYWPHPVPWQRGAAGRAHGVTTQENGWAVPRRVRRVCAGTRRIQEVGTDPGETKRCSQNPARHVKILPRNSPTLETTRRPQRMTLNCGHPHLRCPAEKGQAVCVHRAGGSPRWRAV